MNFESFEDIKVLMDNFDPAALLPDLTTVVGKVEFITRLAVMVGPVVLLTLGILYFFAAPKEANYRFGYRCYFGMGSEEAWRFTQRFAGLVWGVLGLVLTVVMLIITGSFAGNPIMDIIGKGAKCLLWEGGLILVSILGINLTAMLCYDRKGLRRKTYED
jgi:uncharacterized membrane protein